MELQEGFETSGKFWIDTQNHYSNGFLSIKDKKIELRLCNSSGHYPMILDHKTPLMYGWTDQGFLILSELYSAGRYDRVSCFHRIDGHPEIIIYGYKFVACKAFLLKEGKERFLENLSLKSVDDAISLSKDKTLKSNNLTFYIDHSDKWMSIDIAREHPILCDENREIKHYEIHGIKNLYIELDNQVKLKIIVEKLMQRKIRFELIDNSGNPDINKLIELSKKITYFLQFSLFSKVKMYGINTRINRTDINIYDSYIPDYVENIDNMQILFDVYTINKLGCDIENILNCWISKFDLFETPLQLYLKEDSEYRFFDLRRCLEKLASELANINSKSYKCMFEEFVEYSENILSITKEEYKDKYDEIMKRIIEIRNCFAHGWREFKQIDPINDRDAHNERFYNHLMEFIFKSIILKELDLSDDNVKSIMQNNYIKYQIHTIKIK